MKHIATIIITLFIFSSFAFSADSPQKITLNAPVMAEDGATQLVIKSITLDWESPAVHIRLGEPGENGLNYPAVTYKGDDALTMLNQINTLNLTTNSLCKRILQRLITDGYLPAGTITTP